MSRADNRETCGACGLLIFDDHDAMRAGVGCRWSFAPRHAMRSSFQMQNTAWGVIKSVPKNHWVGRALRARRGGFGYPFSGEAQAGGLPEFSRWLSEARRATPPVFVIHKKSHPGGMPDSSASGFWHPSRVRVSYYVFRWCRALTRPQPPANICQASGLMRLSSSPLNGYGFGETALPSGHF